MLKIKKLLPAIVALMLLASCGSNNEACETQDYFLQTQIKAPALSSTPATKHMLEFETYYNELAFAAEVKNRDALPELSRLFSDWVLQAVAIKATLPAGEQSAFDQYLNQVNEAWNKEKNRLL